ncbi:unnamed protein product [Victoria cruziana]
MAVRNEAGDQDEGFSDLFVTQHGLSAKLADCTSQKSKKTRLIINQTDELPNTRAHIRSSNCYLGHE